MRTIIILPLFAVASIVNAQSNDSLPERRNTIKFNLISSFLYSNSGAVSFERVSKKNQSWGVMLGYVQFPNLGSLGSSITSKQTFSNTGYVIGGEYRFYLGKENKFGAPHGVYIGPYANYFNFSNSRDLIFTTSSGTQSNATLESKITVLNIGAQLGYQFLLNDRWTFDFIFVGPSISNYAMDLSMTGNFDVTEEDILANQLLKAITDRFPLVKDLLTDQKVDVHGTNSKWGTGFRYQMNIGYHFGRGKKK